MSLERGISCVSLFLKSVLGKRSIVCVPILEGPLSEVSLYMYIYMNKEGLPNTSTCNY